VGVAPWCDRGLDVELTRGDGPRVLRVQLAGRFPNVAVLAPSPDEPADRLPPTLSGGETPNGRPPAHLAPAGADRVEVLATLLANRPPFDPPSPPLPPGPPRVSPDLGGRWLEAWDELAQREADRQALARRARAVARTLASARKRLARRLSALDRDAERARQGEEHRLRGELLKGLLGRIPRGADGVQARDWSREGAPEVWIPLDPARSAVENMRRYFQRYRKATRAAAPIAARRAEARDELRRLEDARAALEAVPWEDSVRASQALGALERAWRVPSSERGAPGPGGPGRPNSKGPPRRQPFHRFRGAGGAEILVGRTARDNDGLTFRHARGRDIWLHLRDGPGSHVILRHDAQEAPPPEAALQDAALLAAWYSSARGEPLVEVLWTRRKHVRRPPGAPPGQVTVADAKTRVVRANPARLKELHEDAGDGGPAPR